MKLHITGRIFFGAICIALADYAYPEDNQQYVYLEETHGVESSHTLITRHNGKDVELRWIAPDKAYFNLCDETGNTREWRFHDDISDVNATRNGNIIRLVGTRNGQTIRQTTEIDESPWFQPLSYSLGRFSQSRLDSVVFWTIRPDTFDIVKLRARNKGDESIMTDTGYCLTHKISISIAGLLSHFWQAHYWFRQEDGLFIRYEGANGLPGTPTTTIQLDG